MKRRCTGKTRKKKAPSGGLGEMIVGSIVYAFILLFLVSHKQAFLIPRLTEQSEGNIFVKVGEAVYFNLDKYIFASGTLEL